MVIEKVKLAEDGSYIVNGSIHVPNTPGNRHYAMVQEWIANGNTPEPWESREERIQRLFREKCQEIDAEFTAVVDQFRDGYTQDEINSWSKQIEEARAYQEDPSSPTPLLSGILSSRTDLNNDMEELVSRVLQKAEMYSAALGPAMGRKQARRIALDAIDLDAPDAEQQIAGV